MINNITIKNYRNIQNLNSELTSNQILVVAPNGSGKTNLLESIFYSVFRTSFRPMESYKELVNIEKDSANITIEWKDNSILQTQINTSPKLSLKITFMNKAARKKKILEKYPLVLFAPTSIDLVNGEPELRRKDLDFFLSTLLPDYADKISRYKKVLKNRNTLIKMIQAQKADYNQLEFWTNEIARLCGEIQFARQNTITAMQPYINKTFPKFFHNVKSFSISYSPNLLESEDLDKNQISEKFLEKYSENLDKEIIVGKTLYGIHKDDYRFIFDDKQLKYKGSRGQQRIGSFIIKVAQYLLLKEEKQIEEALFLIDDIMSELDLIHRNNLGNYLVQENFSCILTSPNLDEIPEVIRNRFQQIKLN